MSSDIESVLGTIRAGDWTTADLVRIAAAVGELGKNTTSILGQYGEELVAAAYGGTVAGFDTKAYDVRTPHDGDLQVKTFSVGKRPGVIRSFTHDVITVAIDPATAGVVSARRYAVADLLAAFTDKYDGKYAAMGMAWGGAQEDRFERGWSISTRVQSTDVTDLLRPWTPEP